MPILAVKYQISQIFLLIHRMKYSAMRLARGIE